jgi:hypothetical protein
MYGIARQESAHKTANGIDLCAVKLTHRFFILPGLAIPSGVVGST